MESPLLTKSEHNVENITVHGDPSPADEHIVDITTNGDPSPADGHIFDTTINGDPSLADEQTSHEAFQWSCPFINGIVWILVELAVTLVQIVAAIFLILTKDEQHPELGLPLFVWIICYTCASIVSFPVICWRLWHYIQNASSETRYTNCVSFSFFQALETDINNGFYSFAFAESASRCSVWEIFLNLSSSVWL